MKDSKQVSTILLVDDEHDFRGRLKKAFVRRGFNVCEADCFQEAVKAIQEHNPDMAVIDLRMPGRSGLELIAEAAGMAPGLRMVVLTGYGSIATATEAVRLGAKAYLPKPANVDDILRAFASEENHSPPREEDDFQTPSLARAEWEHINRVLADCGGNITLAAQRLGLHRRTLQRKLQKYPPLE